MYFATNKFIFYPIKCRPGIISNKLKKFLGKSIQIAKISLINKLRKYYIKCINKIGLMNENWNKNETLKEISNTTI